MLEVEIKARIENIQNIESALLALGFQKGRLVREEDLYFSGGRNSLKADEALRIRKEKDMGSGAQTNLLTYKGPKQGEGAKIREECETAVADAEAAVRLLRRLGFLPAYAVCKTRAYFSKGRVTACLDEVEGLGLFIELETLAEEAEPSAVSDQFALLQALGVEKERCTDRSYLELLLAAK